MMKAILGSALGGVAAGVLALVASAQGRPATAAADPWALQAAGAPRAVTVAETQGTSTATTNAPTLVQCEPQQEAVLRRSVVAGREVAEVTCLSTRANFADGGYVDRPTYRESDIVTRPVARTQTVRPRTVRTTSTYSDRSYSRQSVETPKRSWQKSAMIIGGSAAGGAGIGAIAGGKKGALIGAALGGGAATIYEAVKHR